MPKDFYIKKYKTPLRVCNLKRTSQESYEVMDYFLESTEKMEPSEEGGLLSRRRMELLMVVSGLTLLDKLGRDTSGACFARSLTF